MTDIVRKVSRTYKAKNPPEAQEERTEATETLGVADFAIGTAIGIRFGITDLGFVGACGTLERGRFELYE